MAILFHGTTLSELIPGEINSANHALLTTAARIAPYCAEGVSVGGGEGTGISCEFTASSEIWVSFYTYEFTSGTNFPLLDVLSAGVPLFQLDRDSTTTIAMEYWNGSAWVEIAADSSFVSAVRYRIDVHIKIDNTVGIIDWYVDGILRDSFSGDTLYTAATTVDKVVLRATTTAGLPSGNFSAIIIADEDTRDMIYSQTPVDGAGAETDWSGAYTAIDETGVNDADFIQSTTAGQRATFSFGNLHADFATGYDVVGVGVSARGSRGASGPANLKPLVRSGTTNGEGDPTAMDLTWKPARHFFALNPATTAAFTVSEVDSAQIGVRSAA